MAYYRILSLDGGGIRGVLTARLMERLDDERPGWLDGVDLFAGTSTGGLLALGMASGMTPTEVRELYEHSGRVVFQDTLLDDLRDAKFKNLPGLLGADYDSEPLKEILEWQFGTLTLGDLKKRVLITAFDLDNEGAKGRTRSWKPKFFHNFPGKDSDGSTLVVDVAMATSAAPTYFPIYKGFVDGGVVANNPSVCALAQAMHEDGAERSLGEIVLLSLGTGFNPRFVEVGDARGDWGLVRWAPHIINLMLDGASGVAEYQCDQLLRNRFLRVNAELDREIELDRIDFIPRLVEIADAIPIQEAIAFLDSFFKVESSAPTSKDD